MAERGGDPDKTTAPLVGPADTDVDPPRATVTIDRGEASPAMAVPTERAAGEFVGRYCIERRIGAGGMGEVYAAIDPELKRTVALKLVRPDSHRSADADETRARLLREAQALAKLSHPNVVTVYDAGVVGDDVFIAMELVEGRTLSKWVADEQPRVRDLVLAVCAAARGLSAAHKSGLVHRDIKPSNILVGDDGRTRVLDFGLARAHLSSHGGASALTADGGQTVSASDIDVDSPVTETGALLGTPPYMAPETLMDGAATEAADQYSLFVTLYESIFGERPYPAGSLAQRITNFLEDERNPVPDQPAISRQLKAAIERGLSVAADRRFASMTAAADALERSVGRRRVAAWLAAGGVAAAAAAVTFAVLSGPGEDSCKSAGTDSTLWTAEQRSAVRTKMTALPGGADAWIPVERSAQRFVDSFGAAARDACVRARDELDTEPIAAARAVCLEAHRAQFDETIKTLLAIENQKQLARAPRAIADVNRVTECSSPAMAVSALPDGEDARAKVAGLEQELGRIQAMRSAGDYQGAHQAIAKAAADAEATGHQPLIARALLLRGSIERVLGEKVAVDTLRRAARAAALAKDDLTASRAWRRAFVSLASSRQDRGRLNEVAEMLPVVEAAVLRSGNPTEKVMWQYALTSYHAGKGDFAKAMAAAQHGLELARTEVGETSPEVGILSGAVGKVASRTGDHKTAIAAFERNLAAARHNRGESHPDVASALEGLAETYASIEQTDKALELLGRANRILATTTGKSGPRYADGLKFYARLQAQNGEFPQAKKNAQAAVDAMKAARGDDHPSVAIMLAAQGSVLQLAGENDEASAAYESALRITEATGGKNHPRTAMLLNNLGNIASDRKDYKQMLAYHRRSLDILRLRFGPDDPQTMLAEYSLGASLVEAGGAKEAVGHLDRAMSCGDRCRPSLHFQAKFMRAQAMWKLDKRQRKLALKMANEALVEARAKGTAADVAQIEEWIKAP